VAEVERKVATCTAGLYIHVALCEIVDFVKERYFGENLFAEIGK
jgi:hypothetical protein